MRKYEPKYPFEILDRIIYPNLFRDSNNVVFSENITFLTTENLHSSEIIEEIESRIKKDCRNAELAYRDSSGNRWIFLVLKKNQTGPVLRRMQALYTKLYKKICTQTQKPPPT